MVDQPTTAEELASSLASACSRRNTIEIGGNFSKRTGAGPIASPDVTISTSRLNRILAYEPRDLTISVEAGATYAELSKALVPHRQMIPLDPPFADQATIGGVIASNSSGPRRRLYGTARDLVIGMKFVTLEGKLIQSGGMVVKNVAGLDMAKLMIGSWGTLAAIASVNFKLLPVPAVERTMLLPAESPAAAFEIRDKLIRSVLQPSAIDYVNSKAAADLGFPAALLAVEFGGNEGVIARTRHELAQWAQANEQNPDEARNFWARLQDFTPKFLQKFSSGVMVRTSATLAGMRDVIESLDVPVIARAGSGVVYSYFSSADLASQWIAANPKWVSVVEYAAKGTQKDKLTLWPSPGDDLELMKRVKQMFDPHNLLNRGRYYRLF